MYPMFEVSGPKKAYASWLLGPETSNVGSLDPLGYIILYDTMPYCTIPYYSIILQRRLSMLPSQSSCTPTLWARPALPLAAKSVLRPQFEKRCISSFGCFTQLQLEESRVALTHEMQAGWEQTRMYGKTPCVKIYSEETQRRALAATRQGLPTTGSTPCVAAIWLNFFCVPEDKAWGLGLGGSRPRVQTLEPSVAV